MPDKEKLVVVGNGMAGARFVEELLELDGRDKYDITVFGEEPYGNYNRILLSGVLAGSHDAKDIFINPLAWYEENGITLHAGVRVIGIDRTSKTAYGAGGLLVPYDKLVMATGSSPFIPPIDGLYREDGSFTEGVFQFRSLNDCSEMVEYADGARKAAVIGGGLLGLEAARGLMNRGLEVDVIHLTEYIMDTQLDASSGDMLKQLLEDMGVRFHLEKLTTAVQTDGGKVSGVTFRDGGSIKCDMLVVSAGIRPNIDLARMTGLNLRRGILVNDDLSCRNDRHIYAIGECAEHRSKTYGLVAPLWEQARTLAERLTSENSTSSYYGSKVSTKLKVMGVELAVAGDKEPASEDDEVVSYVEPNRGVYKKVIIRDGKVAGAILLGDGFTAPRLLQAFDRGETLPQNRAELLFPLSAETAAPDLANLPDDAQICNCNGVSKAKIIAAVDAGHRSLKAVCGATKAGTGCGSCVPQVQALLEIAADGLIADDPAEHYYVPSIPMTKPELVDAIKRMRLKSVSAVFDALAGGKEDAASKMGLASLLKTLWADEYEDERDARFINDRVHANIQRDGTFSVVPRIYGGITSPDELRRIADAADKYEAKMVKITGGQRIDLLGIPKAHLPDVWRDLKMPSGHAYSKAFRTCKTCVGTDFCRYGVGDSVALGVKIEKRFQGVESPHKMKLAASGCPRNCAESTTKDLGVVAIEGGKWEIYIGGAAGSRVRKGDILCIVDSHDDVLKYMGRFMQYYRENAKYLERTYGFVERVGLEHIRSVVVDDSEGICERLDADMQAAVDAYQDPWQESELPVHPNQFVSIAAGVTS